MTTWGTLCRSPSIWHDGACTGAPSPGSAPVVCSSVIGFGRLLCNIQLTIMTYASLFNLSGVLFPKYIAPTLYWLCKLLLTSCDIRSHLVCSGWHGWPRQLTQLDSSGISTRWLPIILIHCRNLPSRQIWFQQLFVRYFILPVTGIIVH
jgi:hypothetical protein